jgi:two-component system NarL family response regulator
MGGAVREVVVLLVDDHLVLAEALAAALRTHPEAQTVLVASCGVEGARLALEQRPDMILVDYMLPDCSGVELVETLLRVSPSSRIAMLTAADTDEVLSAAVRAGVSGFISKSEPLARVVQAIIAVAHGDVVLPQQAVLALLRSQPTTSRTDNPLTPRECEVLKAVSEGVSNREIAASLYVSVHTVRNHVSNILRKLDAHSKLEALVTASTRGYIQGWPFTEDDSVKHKPL